MARSSGSQSKKRSDPSAAKSQKPSGTKSSRTVKANATATVKPWQNPIVLLSLLATIVAYYIGSKHSKAQYPGPFEVVNLPGKGKGMVATRDILQGEMILREAPLLDFDATINQDPELHIYSLVQGLTEERRSAYLALDFHPKDLLKSKIPMSVAQTNGVSAGPGRVGIFRHFSRINHACSFAFNSIYSWRPDDGVLVVHALRNIAKGEEILTSYFDTKRPRNPRRDHLLDRYHFNCSCAACSQPEDLLSASDNRLLIMSSFYQRLAGWSSGEIDGKEASSIAINIWEVGEEEGYRSERGQLASDMAWVAAAHSDARATSQWADLAVRWFGFELGADSEAVSRMKQLSVRPEAHPQWATRAPMPVDGPLTHY